MTKAEIPEAVDRDCRISDFGLGGIGLGGRTAYYISDPDCFGNNRLTEVYFDGEGRVVGWETHTVSWSCAESLSRFRKLFIPLTHFSPLRCQNFVE
jgi:hypothetical protein